MDETIHCPVTATASPDPGTLGCLARLLEHLRAN